MDMEKLRAENLQILIKSIERTFEFRVAAIQMKSETRNPQENLDNVVELLHPTLRYMLQDNCDAVLSSFLA